MNTDKKQLDKSEWERLDSFYREYREQLHKEAYEASKRFDHWTLTLSSGGLALSVSIANLATLKADTQLWAIWTSWILYGTTIGLSLLSIYFTQTSREKFIDTLDEEAKTLNKSFLATVEKKNDKLFRSNCIPFLNLFSFLFFCTASIFFGWFSINTLQGEFNMSDKNHTKHVGNGSDGFEKKGAKPCKPRIEIEPNKHEKPNTTQAGSKPLKPIVDTYKEPTEAPSGNSSEPKK